MCGQAASFSPRVSSSQFTITLLTFRFPCDALRREYEWNEFIYFSYGIKKNKTVSEEPEPTLWFSALLQVWTEQPERFSAGPMTRPRSISVDLVRKKQNTQRVETQSVEIWKIKFKPARICLTMNFLTSGTNCLSVNVSPFDSHRNLHTIWKHTHRKSVATVECAHSTL